MMPPTQIFVTRTPVVIAQVMWCVSNHDNTEARETQKKGKEKKRNEKK
jgi:hypothetical protein